MFCPNCGSKISDDVQFCPSCGTRINGNSNMDQPFSYREKVAQQEARDRSYTNNTSNDSLVPIIKVAGIAGAIIFVILGWLYFWSGLSSFFSFIINSRYIGSFVYLLLYLALSVLRIFVGLVCVLVAGLSFFVFRSMDKENSLDFVITLGAGSVLAIVFAGIHRIFVNILWGSYTTGTYFKWIFLASLILVGGLFLLMYVGKWVTYVDTSNPTALVTNAITNIMGIIRNDAGNLANQAQQKSTNTSAQNNTYQPVQQEVPVYANLQRPPYRGVPLQTDRNLVIVLLLSTITCGIYSYYFLYSLAKDLNVVCDGDGEKTPGLLALILLSWVTCGLYGFYWYYKVGRRLYNNAPRYGLEFEEGGGTLLTWMIVGTLLMGAGLYVSMYIVCRNTNIICKAYNRGGMR